jgi:gliding motility-associated-like protein
VDEVSYFEIYDRWGEKVWESDDLKGQWDGNKQGVPLNGGMYLYKIKYTCNNEEYLKIDNFMMLR